MSKLFLLVRQDYQSGLQLIKKASPDSTQLYKEMDFFKNEWVVPLESFVVKNKDRLIKT